MTERIVKIGEFVGNDFDDDGDDYGYSGYKIHTDKQVISLLISNGQSCCEDWGYLMSEELNEGDDFIGANIISIEPVSLADIIKDEDEDDDDLWNYAPCIFINVNTDRGTLQFKAYNSHNGYYGHDVRVHSEQLKLEETL
tara:strand:+ start:801 stop:1220 length:420 start_codon:yes stop_codon:yes gene_type:complete